MGGTPGVGVEPTTTQLKAERSTTELTGIGNLIIIHIMLKPFYVSVWIKKLTRMVTELCQLRVRIFIKDTENTRY